MKDLAAWRSFARAWLLRSRMEQEMDAEMRFHLEARAADLVAQGFSRADADRRARQEFGDIVRWKEAGRDARGLGFVDELAADLRYAVRTMRRTPGFTAAAVVSLALGIGANTAIFGLMDLLLFRPVPVERPGELVHVTTGGERLATSGSSNSPWFEQVAARTDLFAGAMLVRHDRYKVSIGGVVEPLTGQRVTTNYYNLLGVQPLIGRTFTPADQPGANNASPVAVISYGLWQRRFGGRPDVLGASITVDQQPYTIVGVTPPAFRGILVGWTTDVTMPLDLSNYEDPAGWSTMPLIARVRPGVEPERIEAQLTAVLQRFAASTDDRRYRARYLERVVVESAAAGVSNLRAQFSTPLRLLMVSVGLLLLIACGNLAGLLVARNTARQHELGIRFALGAGRRRIIRQLLTESALLAVIGAVPGVLLGVYGSNLLLRFTPEN